MHLDYIAIQRSVDEALEDLAAGKNPYRRWHSGTGVHTYLAELAGRMQLQLHALDLEDALELLEAAQEEVADLAVAQHVREELEGEASASRQRREYSEGLRVRAFNNAIEAEHTHQRQANMARHISIG